MSREPRSGRTWGYWTRGKLRILSEYLDRFTTASKSVTERVYLDAFAGEGTGVDRLTGEEFAGSSRIALETSNPPFTRLRFFELPRKAASLELRMRELYPNRDIRVYGGDCNVEIPKALTELRRWAWAPAFAFLDPDGMELAWETLTEVAQHRVGKAKVEMWSLFPDMGLLRTLALDREPTDRDIARATRLLGTDEWLRILELRRKGLVDGWAARRAYLNLFRWRLEHELEYRWTHPLGIRNLQNRPMYEMVFATDHPAGIEIMSSLYGRAEIELDAMRQDAVAESKGAPRLFRLAELEVRPRRYEYVPPYPPGKFPDVQ